MTPLEAYLGRIKEYTDKATDGPWEYERTNEGGDVCAHKNGIHVCEVEGAFYNDDGDNGNFIAAIRTDAPVLLEMLVFAMLAVDDLDKLPERFDNRVREGFYKMLNHLAAEQLEGVGE